MIEVAPVTLWQPRPDVALLVVALFGGYTYALGRWRGTLAPDPPATRGQKWCFYAGVLLIWVAADGPIDRIGETYLFSVHMVQMLLLMLVAPPLLLLGMPGWLLRRALSVRVAGTVARQWTKPLYAALIFNAVIAVSAWPLWVDLYLRYDLFHLAVHVLWVSSALAWWFPVLSPLPEMPHLSYPRRMLHLLAQSFLPTIPASFLTFATEPMYDFYVRAARIVPLSVVEDQQLGGLVMKLGGGLLLWVALGALFARWAHEERTGAPDWLYARDVGEPLLAADR